MISFMSTGEGRDDGGLMFRLKDNTSGIIVGNVLKSRVSNGQLSDPRCEISPIPSHIHPPPTIKL